MKRMTTNKLASLIDTEVGAEPFAKQLKALGFEAASGSRLVLARLDEDREALNRLDVGDYLNTMGSRIAHKRLREAVAERADTRRNSIA